ncbi:MAG: TrkA family potassium uptake protein [Lachnospiraceae bacterium]|nr:TrkA family potassium uptake protein [Lachnospiraceae bacterium]
MKSVLIIGMGRFGHHLAKNMLELGNDVMIIDSEESKLEDMVPYATSAKIGDCTNTEVLKSLGIGNFDIVFVCIGTNFQSSLEITSLVKEMGGRHVVSKATRDIQAKFLLRNGADEVIYPEKDIAEKCAERYSMDNVFDYIELDDDYAIYEIPPLKEWIGCSIREADIARKHHVTVLGIKDRNGEKRIMPSADYVVDASEHLMVLAGRDTISKLLKQIKHF